MWAEKNEERGHMEEKAAEGLMAYNEAVNSSNLMRLLRSLVTLKKIKDLAVGRCRAFNLLLILINIVSYFDRSRITTSKRCIVIVPHEVWVEINIQTNSSRSLYCIPMLEFTNRCFYFSGLFGGKKKYDRY